MIQQAEKELIYEENALYIFDFDGTLYPKDSMIEFLKFYSGSLKFYLKLTLFIWPTILYLFKIKDNDAWKEALLNIYLKGHLETQIKLKANLFAENEKNKIFPEASKYIKELLKKGNQIYIISASLDVWLNPLIADLKCQLISTTAHFEQGRFLGIDGRNCNGENKVLALKKHINLDNYSKIISFGNSTGDFGLYALSDNFYHEFFK